MIGKSSRAKTLMMILVILVVSMAAANIGKALPTIGDPDTPANGDISTYYIEHAVEDTNSPNLVTAVLADYRGFDTLFETCVLYLSGVVAMVTLSKKKKVERRRKVSDRPLTSFDSLVLDRSYRLLVPILCIYALYVLLHGEVSLGGGFQAGAVLATAYFLDRVTAEVDVLLGIFHEGKALCLAGLGTFLYAFTGILCMVGGGNFLDYSALPFGATAVEELHSIGILMIEIGVTVCVMAVIINILELLLRRTPIDD